MKKKATPRFIIEETHLSQNTRELFYLDARLIRENLRIHFNICICKVLSQSSV